MEEELSAEQMAGLRAELQNAQALHASLQQECDDTDDQEERDVIRAELKDLGAGHRTYDIVATAAATSISR